MIDQRHTNKIFCGSVLHYLILPRRQCQGFSGCEKTTPAGASWIREKYKPFISIPNILPNHQFCHVPVKGIRLDVQGSSAFHRHAPFFTGASVCLLRPETLARLCLETQSISLARVDSSAPAGFLRQAFPPQAMFENELSPSIYLASIHIENNSLHEQVIQCNSEFHRIGE